MIIAVDGPLASGKGTIARALADHFGLPHLDTGSLYRATGLAVIEAGIDPDDAEACARLAAQLDLAAIDEDRIRTAEAGSMASRVAAIPQVREALFDLQRAFATQPGGAILDGRDIGTVICPDAEVKLFVIASPEVRAGRRLRDIESRGGRADFEEILADIKRRDERDTGRADSPLRPAADAHLLDTSEMTIEAAFQAARGFVDAAMDAN